MLLGDRLDGWQVTGVPENVYRQDRHNPPSSMAGWAITPPAPCNGPPERAQAPPRRPGALDGILDRKPVQMSAQPLSRAPQPLVKRDPRFPTEQVSRAGRIRLQHHHLALARADPI